MELKRNGSRPSIKGAAENFTGNVRIDPLFQSPGPAQFSGGLVTSSPARAPRGIRIPAVRR